ncbi:MAG: GNAT family N-acetyltransferase [Candidatus Moranbacteria bacterium]|nr:GNAT family N-acetyltransferase [Candidatus Moranbacteria bacterium]
MDINQEEIESFGVKFSAKDESGKEIGRAFLYVMKNDLHQRPFGFMEDVFVKEEARGQGIGKKLVQAVVEKARENSCYKLIATSRHSREKVHQMYENLGFYDQGLEFRIDFKF